MIFLLTKFNLDHFSKDNYRRSMIYQKLEKIEYEGTVWAINHGLPEPLLNHCIKKLVDHGIKKEDIIITDAPSDVKIGTVVVDIWPYHLEVGRVRTVRNDSYISGSVLIIELKADSEGTYID
jgi:hypothetical protein